MSTPEPEEHPQLHDDGQAPPGRPQPQVEGPAEVDLSRQRLLELMQQGRGPAVPYDLGRPLENGDPVGPGSPGPSATGGGTTGRGGGGSPQTFPAEPFCPDVQTWVTVFFAPVFVRRATPTFKWCAEWWRHPEAVVRLEALWRSWEVLRLDPGTGGGVWLREFLDVQLAQVTGSAGPFHDCDPTRHHQAPTSLQLKAVPPGWFPAPPR